MIVNVGEDDGDDVLLCVLCEVDVCNELVSDDVVVDENVVDDEAASLCCV